MIDELAEASFLFHWSPPVAIGPSPRLFLMAPGSKPEELNLKQLAAWSGPVVAPSFALLVEWFRAEGLPLPPRVIDIEVGLKLLVGMRRPGPSTSLRAFLVNQLAEDLDLAIVCNQNSLPPGDEVLVRGQGLQMAQLCGAAWPEMVEALVGKGEAQRFVEVEVPVYNVMLQSQMDGIAIDRVKCDQFVEVIESEYEALVYQLSITQGICIERAYADSSYLAEVARLPLEGQPPPPAQLLEQWKGLSRECTDLRQVRRLRVSRDILIRAMGSDFQRCYVSFDTMGTVTGRILAVDPHLQNLKKKYRAVLKPDPDHHFVYVDFRQFEPCIMASLSGDAGLRERCASGDLYSSVAEGLGRAGLDRGQAKKMYLAYSYGMSLPNMLALASRMAPDVAGGATSVVRRLQAILAGVETWKSDVWKRLEAEGRIGTQLGNFRYRSADGGLSESERRWSVSQVIQGTGSLILKRLCILVDRLGGGPRVALPMHDALLLQVPVDLDDRELDAEIRVLSKRAFNEFCPDVEVEVERRSFIQ